MALEAKWTQKLKPKIRKMFEGYNGLDGSGYHFGGTMDKKVQDCFKTHVHSNGQARSARMASYERLEDDELTPLELNDDIIRLDENSVELKFYMQSPEVTDAHTLLITENMTARDVIKQISLEVCPANSHIYSIMEFWKEYKAERMLDDHEILYDLKCEHLTTGNRFIFVFHKDLDRYMFLKEKDHFFIHPERARRFPLQEDPNFVQVLDPFFSKQGFPEAPKEPSSPSSFKRASSTDLITFDQESVQYTRLDNPDPSPSTSTSFEESSSTDDTSDEMINPIFCGTIYMKPGRHDFTIEQVEQFPGKTETCTWPKKYLLLRDRQLFFVENHDMMLKCYYMEDDSFRALLQTMSLKKDKHCLELIGRMSDYEVYTSSLGKRYHNAPHGGTIYLRSNKYVPTKPIRLMFCPKPKDNYKYDNEEGGGLDRSLKWKNLWITALRLAKHGNRIKVGYLTYLDDLREYRKKLQQQQELQKKQKKRGQQKKKEETRVAMDFSGGQGKIISDKTEIEEVKRLPKQMGSTERQRYDHYETFPKEALSEGSHTTQKYYHGELSRDEAEKLLLENGTNGVWLLRDSHARTNCLTISYLYENRVHHKYISASSYNNKPSKKKIYAATLDQQIGFRDVHTLTEYYRANKGDTMMCMLGASIKKESQRDSSPPRDGSSKRIKPIKLRQPSQRDKDKEKEREREKERENEKNRSPQSPDINAKSPRSLTRYLPKTLQKVLRPKKLDVMPDEASSQDIQDEKLEPETSPQSDVASTSGVSSGTPETPSSSTRDESPILPHSNDPPSSSSQM